MTAENNQSLLLFRIAEIACAVPAETVGSILMPPAHLTHTPGSNAGNPGIFHHADATYPVIDLHQRFGITLPRRGIGRLLLQDEGIRHFAFWVDEVIGLVRSEQGQWARLPAYLPHDIFQTGFLYQEEIVLCSELSFLRNMRDAEPLRQHLKALQEKKAANDEAKSAQNTAIIPPHKAAPTSQENPAPPQQEPVLPTTTSQTEAPGKPVEKSVAARNTTAVSPDAEKTPLKPASVEPSTDTVVNDIGKQHRAPQTDTPNVTAVTKTPGRTTGTIGKTKPKPTATARNRDIRPIPPATAPQPRPPGPSYVESHYSDDSDPALLWLGLFLLLMIIIPVAYWFWPSNETSVTREPKPVVNNEATASSALDMASTITTPESSFTSDAFMETETTPTLPAETGTDANAEDTVATDIVPTESEAPVTAAVTEAHTDSTVDETVATSTIAPEGIETASQQKQDAPLRIEHDDDGVINLIIDRKAAETATAEKETPVTAEKISAETTATKKSATVNEHCNTCIHIVVKGDTLWDIAELYTGNAFNYPELAKLSGIKNPDRIYPGNRVRIIIH